jgi:hypothetical protein
MTAGCQTGNVGNALNSQTTPTRSQCPLELHFQQPARERASQHKRFIAALAVTYKRMTHFTKDFNNLIRSRSPTYRAPIKVRARPALSSEFPLSEAEPAGPPQQSSGPTPFPHAQHRQARHPRNPFWRGETGAAWEFHGSDGSAGAPGLSIHLCRCGLAFIVCLGVVTPDASWCSMVQRDAPWCNGATARRRLRVLRVTCNAGDVRCRPWSTTMRRQTAIQSAIVGFICHALGPVEDQS